MKYAILSRLLTSAALAAGLLAAHAQTPPPGGAPGGPGGPGGFPGPHGAPPSVSHSGDAASIQHDAHAASPARNALQFGPVGRWWDDHAVAQQVGISREQQRRMDAIFNASKPAIVQSYKAYLKAQSNLDRVNKDTSAAQAQVFAAVDAVNQARSALQKTTLAMLMQIRGQMDATQLEKLQKLP